MIGVTFEHRGKQYGYLYIDGIRGLTLDDEVGLLKKLVDMADNKKKRTNLKSKTYEGFAVNKGMQLFGNLYGRWFQVYLELDSRTQEICYLLTKLNHDSSLN